MKPPSNFTPPHAEVLALPYPFHCLYRPVTSLALYAGVHVSAVIEVDEIREFVNLDPGYWIPGSAGVGLPVLIKAHRFIQFSEFGRNDGLRLPLLLVRLFVLGSDCPQGSYDKAVAVHTYVGGRDASMTAFFRPKMAVKATDLKFLGM